ncbi:MAG: phospholipase [Labilithrix sp.]|nr:phospholipase [Labilithrix sp.]MCW5811358.1 phospholipase [Labilithrix sp.]
MSTSTLGPLTVRRFVKGAETQDKPPLHVVLLHGFGAPGDDLAGLADAIDVPPGTTLVFPEAVHALAEITGQRMYGDARAWWMIDMVRLQLAMASGLERDMSSEVPEGLAEARAAVNAMLDALAKEAPDARLILGGFSQGAMLSLDVALRDPSRRLAGLVLLSGTLIAEAEWRPLLEGRRGLPVFQSHGRTDPILSYGMAERLSSVLKEGGLDVTFDPFSGPHTIPLSTLGHLSAWIRARA